MVAEQVAGRAKHDASSLDAAAVPQEQELGLFQVGAAVEYYSQTVGRWIPAVVQGFDKVRSATKGSPGDAKSAGQRSSAAAASAGRPHAAADGSPKHSSGQGFEPIGKNAAGATASTP